jgi:hypothetical protein
MTRQADSIMSVDRRLRGQQPEHPQQLKQQTNFVETVERYKCHSPLRFGYTEATKWTTSAVATTETKQRYRVTVTKKAIEWWAGEQ